MSSTKDRVSPEAANALQQNALQSDFNADDTRSMDSDERYLV